MSAISINIVVRRSGFRLRAGLGLPGDGVTALLGPSGSGKTTLLRVIAGLERHAEGKIIAGESIWFDASRRIQLTPQQRRVGMVFQDYALFDHMTVAANVGFGLPRRRRAITVAEWLERLHLGGLAPRYPHELSGGQRQRVALARALAPAPDVLLLDEPFSAVDYTLRRHLRAGLLEVVQDLRLPVIIVTHDLDEARHLAQRVGVLVDGELLRLGPTEAVFADPGSRAIAQVLGWSNFLPVRRLMGRRVAGPWGEIELEREPSIETAWLGIRPEHLRLAHATQPGLPARITGIRELGAVREISCRLEDGTMLTMHRPWDDPVPASGSRVRLHLPLPWLRCLADAGPARVVPGHDGDHPRCDHVPPVGEHPRVRLVPE